MTGPVTIRVVITGPAHEGRFPFRIDTEGTRLSVPYNGLSATPLLDACRVLKQLAAASDAAFIGLYDKDCNLYRMRTQVAYGAKYAINDMTRGGPVYRPFVPMPEGVIAAKEAGKTSGGTEMTPQEEKPAVGATRTEETASGVETTGAKPARSPAAPPPPHKPRALQGGTGQGRSAPAKPKSSPHKPKPTGSGGRRGRR